MTHTFNISLKLKYREDLVEGLTQAQRDQATDAAEEILANWMSNVSIPSSKFQVQTATMSSPNIAQNSELLEACVARVQEISGDLPHQLKNASVTDPNNQTMIDSGCTWVPTPPTPPPPAGYWECSGQPLSLSTVIDMEEESVDVWKVASAGNGQVRCTVSIKAKAV